MFAVQWYLTPEGLNCLANDVITDGSDCELASNDLYLTCASCQGSGHFEDRPAGCYYYGPGQSNFNALSSIDETNPANFTGGICKYPGVFVYLIRCLEIQNFYFNIAAQDLKLENTYTIVLDTTTTSTTTTRTMDTTIVTTKTGNTNANTCKKIIVLCHILRATI